MRHLRHWRRPPGSGTSCHWSLRASLPGICSAISFSLLYLWFLPPLIMPVMKKSLSHLPPRKRKELSRSKPSQFFGDEFGVWSSSVAGINGIDKELVDAAVITGACSYDRPGSLTPTHAGKAACALCNSPISRNKTNSFFRSIIGRTDAITR